MTTSANALLGVSFLGLGVLATGLMFQYWGYPFDKEKGRSECPQWKMNIHRAVGVSYAIVYVILMIQMVPRMWEYQVELPARTVAHLMLGMTIGFLLVIKIAILRFWRHFEEWMPVLGTGICLCTFLLCGLSLPFVYKERALVAAAPGGSAFSNKSQARVARLLPAAGFPEDVDLTPLATASSLRDGREVLLGKCVQCHDLKTIISKPRAPADWYRTVSRMAEKPTLGDEISDAEVNESTAFLIAITPDLQKSAKARRAARMAAAETKNSLAGPATPPGGDAGVPDAPNVDPAKAKEVYEEVCSGCHELSDVDGNPPEDEEEVDDLIERMVDNGMEVEDQDELTLVKWYLLETFANK